MKDLKFDEKVQATLLFMSKKSKKEIAEFIVYQSESIEGQANNMESWVKAFHEIKTTTDKGV